jgi:hypothetical protein
MYQPNFKVKIIEIGFGVCQKLAAFAGWHLTRIPALIIKTFGPNSSIGNTKTSVLGLYKCDLPERTSILIFTFSKSMKAKFVFMVF